MPPRPIITLTTDFGDMDFYVAAMKGVLLRYCPDAHIIDVTHQVFRHDLRGASFILERAVSSFDAPTVHLAVVDPGVGSDRRLLVADVNGSTIICPDNGLITWTIRRHPNLKANDLSWRPSTTSNTFHGRDIMAPVAGMIAAGHSRQGLAGDEIAPLLLNMSPSKTASGEVIHIDHFGNATTNILAENLAAGARLVQIGDDCQIPLRQIYSDVAPAMPVALIGSSGLLEIAVRNGSAAEALRIKIGDRVSLLNEAGGPIG